VSEYDAEAVLIYLLRERKCVMTDVKRLIADSAFLTRRDISDVPLFYPGPLAVDLCLSVSVCHKSVFYRNGWTDRADFWRVGFFQSFLHCVEKKFRYLQK